MPRLVPSYRAAAAACLFAALHCANAATFNVTTTADAGAGSLRQAILDANANADPDIIAFDLPGPGPHVINLASSLLGGAFGSVTTDIEVLNDRPTDESVTVQRSFAPGTPDFPLLGIAGRDARVVIAGLTLRNGRRSGTSLEASGGAIQMTGGNLTLRDCVLTENSASYGGALGVYTCCGAPADVTLVRCQFINNTGLNGGGAIINRTHFAPATIRAEQSVFRGNTTLGDGGAIHNSVNRGSASFYLTDCTLSGNTAGAAGGAIFTFGTGPMAQGIVAMNRCTVSANRATGGGARGGGGLRLENVGTVAELENCTLSGNEGERGGAIDNAFAGRVVLKHVTVAENHSRSAEGGGGISCYNACQLSNSVVVANTAASTARDLSGNFSSQGHNLIGSNGANFVDGQNGDQVGSVAVPLEARLAPLRDNGGPTWTHALLPGSPALDKGKSFGTTTDQRGSLRPYDMPGVGNAPGGDAADIGAYEAQAVALVAAVSRKSHGAAGVFDISLPLAGEPGVECRSSSGNHSLVFTFTNTLVSGSADLKTGAGSIQGSPAFDGRTMTVNLTGVSDVQRITLAISDVTDQFGQVLPDAAVSMNMLVGDINASKVVTASDLGQVKASAGTAVTSANFRADVAVSGEITASDIGLVKSRAGQSLP